MLETRLRQDMKESVDKIDEEEESNLFIDPYEGASNVKFLALAAYIFILAGCIILVAFVYYETSGLAGPSRTIFNQMVSWEYRVVVTYCILVVGMDLLRLWIGPLPKVICNLNIVLKNTLFMTWLIMAMLVVFAKFFVLCIWKNLPATDDKRVARYAFVGSLSLALFFALLKVLGPGKPLMSQMICSADYKASYEHLPRRFPIFQVVAGITLIVHFILWIPIQVNRTRHQNQDQVEGLDCTPLTLLLTTIFASGAYATFKINSTQPDQLDQFPNWIYPLFNYFGCPLLVVTFIVFKIIYNNGKQMRREFLGATIQQVSHQ